MKRWIQVFAVTLAVSANVAHADKAADKAKAREYFDSGRDAYKAGRFVAATKAYEESYRLYPHSNTVFSLAQAYRRQYVIDGNSKNLQRALTLYRQYIVEVKQGKNRTIAVDWIQRLQPQWNKIKQNQVQHPVKPQPAPPQPTQLMITSATPGAKAAVGDGKLEAVPVIADVAPGRHPVRIEAPGFVSQTVDGVAVEQRLISVRVQLDPKPATLHLQTREGVDVSINGSSVSRTAAQNMDLPAGTHLVVVRQRGHEPFSRQLSLSRGQKVDLEVSLETTTQRRASYYTAIGAGALLLSSGVTAGLAWRAQGKAQDIEDRVGLDQLMGPDRERHNDLVDQRNAWRLASTILLGGAIAAGTGAALLYWLDDPTPNEQAPRGWQLVPSASPTGAGASVSHSF